MEHTGTSFKKFLKMEIQTDPEFAWEFVLSMEEYTNKQFEVLQAAEKVMFGNSLDVEKAMKTYKKLRKELESM